MKLIFDIETDGFLSRMTRIHSLVIRDVTSDDVDSRPAPYIFRWHDEYDAYLTEEGAELGPISIQKALAADPNLVYTTQRMPAENNIREGVEFLMEADELIGHNIAGFDIPGIKKLFPWFNPKGKIRDTLVIARMVAPDVKLSDYTRSLNGTLPGKLIGSQSLDSWGYRLGMNKGDYSNEMLAAGRNPWEGWNIDMEEYCILDVAVNEVLWAALLTEMPPEMALELEHDSHSVGTKMTESGVPFDAAGALVLADEITTRLENLSKDVVATIGFWYRPKKKYLIRAPYCPEEKIDVEKRKVYPPPRTEWGEDETRAIWAEMQFPKINRKSLKLGDLTIGCPYCPIERVQFNPGSRDHIIDRFTTQYGWQPTEFTETGKPTVDDTTMKVMAETIPMAKPLADIFFYKKIIGQVQFGTNSWLAKYNEDTGCIHHYLNVGGTVSGRCSHNSPNLGQVPAVVAEKTLNKDGTFNKKILDANGNPYPECFDADGKPYAKTLLLGRQGDYGVESRSLFRVPKIIPQVMVDEAGNLFEVPNEWLQVGVDLSGIELRMLAEACSKYDDGELIEVVLSGDIHEYNMSKTGITNRELIKRGTYALLYGAGLYKLGITINPLASISQAINIGRDFRITMMQGLPALKQTIEETIEDASSGYLIGIDGRKLSVRSPHAALNLRLQSAAGLLAKKWFVLTHDRASEQWDYGWNGDFTQMLFIHDEQQSAVKKAIAKDYAALCIQAAADAGKFFNFSIPIAAEAKIGHNWKDTH